MIFEADPSLASRALSLTSIRPTRRSTLGCRFEVAGRSVSGIPVSGNPDPEHISTSYVERQNLNIRMQNRRFTRLTNAFSRKPDNLRHAVALYVMLQFYASVRRSGSHPCDGNWSPRSRLVPGRNRGASWVQTDHYRLDGFLPNRILMM